MAAEPGIRRLSLPKTEADIKLLITDLISKVELVGRMGPELAEQLPPEISARLLRAISVAQASLEGRQQAARRAISRGPEAAVQKICTDLGVFGALAQRQEATFTTDALRTLTRTPIDPGLFRTLLSFAATHGMVDEVRADNWQANSRTQVLAHPATVSGIKYSFGCLDPIWAKLPEALAKNDYTSAAFSETPLEMAHGEGATHSNLLKKDAALLRHWVRYETFQQEEEEGWIDEPESEEIIDFAELLKGAPEERKVFVDVAGGLGTECGSLVAAFPEIAGRTVLQNDESVHALAVSRASSGGGSGGGGSLQGISLQPTDLFDDQPVKGACVYYMKNVLQRYPPNQCVVILGHVMDAMAADSRILIDEMVMPDAEGASRGISKASAMGGHIAEADLTRMLFGGLLRTIDQWVDLLDSVGLEIERVRSYGERARNRKVIVAKQR